MSASRSGTRRRQAIQASILGQMAGGILPTLMREGGVASLFIISAAGSQSTGLIGLAMLIMQWSMISRLLSAPHVDHIRCKRFLQRWLLASSILSAMLLLGPAWVMGGRPRMGVGIFLLVLGGYFLALQTGVTAWFPMLARIIPARLRGRYFGSMRRAWQITSFGAVFLCGWLLGPNPRMVDFLWVLLPAVLLQFGRVLAFTRLPDPPPSRRDRAGFAWRELLLPLRDRPFVGFVIFTIGTGIMQFAALPFAVPFLRSELGFPAGVTLYGTGCFGLGSVLSVVSWGRLADRGGTRLVFLLSGSVAVSALIILAATPSYTGHPAAAVICAMAAMILAGAGGAGIGIGYTVRLMRMAPTSHPSPYLNLCQSAIGLAAGLAAALVGGLLSILPRALSMVGFQVITLRLFFCAVALFLAGLCTLGTRRLPRLGEMPLSRAVRALLPAANPPGSGPG